jgi:hypothetical protein
VQGGRRSGKGTWRRRLAIDGRGRHGLGLRMGSNDLIDHGGFDCLNWLRREEGKVGGTAGRGGDCAAAPSQLGSEERMKKGKGKGRLTGGALVSASRGKRNRRGGEVCRRR